MTEVASDPSAEEFPPLPRRTGRSAASPGSAGPIALGAVAAGLLAAAVVLGYRPARFSGALADLSSEDPAVRGQAREVLLGMKDYAVRRLGGIGASPAAAQRLRAIRAVSLLGLKDDPALVALVRKSLGDPDATVQAEAVAGLGRLASDGSQEALTALLDLADGKPSPLTPAVASALAEVEPPGDAARILLLARAQKALAASPGLPASVRAAYLVALQGPFIAWLGTDQTPPAEQALRTLHAALACAADPDPGIRATSDRILQLIPLQPRDKRIPLALDSLQHEDPWIRTWAEAALRQATGRTAGFDPLAPEKPAAEAWRGMAR